MSATIKLDAEAIARLRFRLTAQSTGHDEAAERMALCDLADECLRRRAEERKEEIHDFCID